MIELNQMLTIYSPLDILHLSYRTLVFEKFKAREDQVAPPKNPTDWKRGVIVKHSTAVFPRQHQEKYDGAYWRRDAYTAKEWTTGTLTTCGAADVTIMLNMLKYIFQPQSVSGTGEPYLENLKVGPTIPARGGQHSFESVRFADWINCMLAYPGASPTLGEMLRTEIIKAAPEVRTREIAH
ncbi:uncharacterized protein AFUA_4G11490 [Aspergillus fumigatus Af293]|uniref:Uncharacterized protein n=1 Tax=Aspergillus fumigatus (strain ATCC MYA-4609 / CBS 101355 / FGSC A1100 / Af293) TaxID=330879 RepID=Q4WQ41_ASPFU|nr:hypothetical protein AFUA_4G11490 [Aspergillus fumigatus Af293]EAL89643.1 hypothetical protein AFUA_4G11490 [Aspergillus fumigatus Af293]